MSLFAPASEEEADHLEVSTLRCDEQGGGTTLQCDVLVGPCIETAKTTKATKTTKTTNTTKTTKTTENNKNNGNNENTENN